MASPDASQLSTRLDEDHHPETNGRTPVCRRCGFRAVGPFGGEQHASVEEQSARAQRWLDSQARLRRVAQAKELLDK